MAEPWTPIREMEEDERLHWEYVYGLTLLFLQAWRTALTRYVATLQSSITLDQLSESVELANTVVAIGAMDWTKATEQLMADVRTNSLNVYERAGLAELKRMKFGFAYDPASPYLTEWINRHTGNLIVQIDEETKRAIRGVILDAFQQNLPSYRAAQKIRSFIGLTDREARAVFRYWVALSEERTLPVTRINELVDQYASKLLDRRAETIARTEIVAAANAAQRGILLEARDRGLIPLDAKREWVAAVESSRTCPVCLELDGTRVGLDEPFPTGVYGPPQHPNCLPGDALVTARSTVTGISKRWCDGDVVVLYTASGRKLSCTPNHPILSRQGWVAAQLLNVDSEVVCDGSRQGEFVVDHNNQYMPAAIHDIAETLFSSGQMAPVKVPTTTEDFHGDGGTSKIAVIGTNRFLGNGINAAFLQHCAQFGLQQRRMRSEFLSGFGTKEQGCHWPLDIANSLMRGLYLFAALLRSHLCPFYQTGFALGSNGYAELQQAAPNCISVHTKLTGNSIFRMPFGVQNGDRLTRKIESSSLTRDCGFLEHPVDNANTDAELARKITSGMTGPVFFDKIIRVEKYPFHGFVYNLQTIDGFYVANGIITHNCRCATVLHTPSLLGGG